jgi:activator of HSP90 ATPase
MTKTISQQVSFRATPKAVFEAFLDSSKHAAFTGAPAEIDRAVGGKFTAWGGHLDGITVDLKKDERIVQAWRVKTWPEGRYSLLTIALEKDGSQTRLSMEHSGVPSEAADMISSGWQERYWSKLKAYLEN